MYKHFCSLAIIYGFFSSFCFVLLLFFFGVFFFGWYNSSWTKYWEDCMFQTQKKIGLLAIINSFFWSFCCYCTDKNMLFTNKTVRRIMWEESRKSRLARSARAQWFMFFLASFWFSGLYKSSWTRHITIVTNTTTYTDKLCDSPTKYWEECKNTQNSACSQSSIAFSRVSGFLVGMKNMFSTQKYKNFGSLAPFARSD